MGAPDDGSGEEARRVAGAPADGASAPSRPKTQWRLTPPVAPPSTPPVAPPLTPPAAAAVAAPAFIAGAAEADAPAADNAWALRARGLQKTFRHERGRLAIIVDRFELRRGAQALMTGPSGSGKSTALGLLGGAIRPSAAERLAVAVSGRMVETDPLAGDTRALERLRARQIAYVAQTGALLSFLTLRQNIAEAVRLADLAGGAAPRASVDELADLLQVRDALDRLPAQTSVGQRQRAAIARALAHGPSVVFADEPTAALDAENAALADRLLAETAEKFGAAVVVATHRVDAPQWRDAQRVHHSQEIDAKGVVSRFAL